MSLNLRLYVLDPTIKSFLTPRTVDPLAIVNLRGHRAFLEFLPEVVPTRILPDYIKIPTEREDELREVNTNPYGNAYEFCDAGSWEEASGQLLQFPELDPWNVAALNFIQALPAETLIIWEWR